MMIEENDKMVSLHFDSLIELLDYDPNLIKIDHNRKLYDSIVSSRKGEDNNTWYGKNRQTGDDVIKDALLGWKDGFEIATERASMLDEDVAKEYTQLVSKYKRKHVKSDFGDEIDIHKVYQGQIDKAWSKTERFEIDVKHKLFTLFIDVGGLSSIDAEDTIWRSAVALKITEQLIKAGKAVKIIVGASANDLLIYNRKKVVTTDITVKQYNEPLSYERLVAMANIGFHRIFTFKSRTMLPYKIDYNFGCTTDTIRHTPPIQIQKDVESGHTRYIYLSQADGLYTAKLSLDSAYNTLSEYSSL